MPFRKFGDKEDGRVLDAERKEASQVDDEPVEEDDVEDDQVAGQPQQ